MTRRHQSFPMLPIRLSACVRGLQFPVFTNTLSTASRNANSPSEHLTPCAARRPSGSEYSKLIDLHCFSDFAVLAHSSSVDYCVSPGLAFPCVRKRPLSALCSMGG